MTRRAAKEVAGPDPGAAGGAGAAGAAGATKAARTRWWPAALVGLLLVVVLRAMLVQSFSVPSGSMEPTIEPGDRVLVNRLVRGDDVRRGDIVVFDGTSAFASEPGSQSDGPSGLLGALASAGRGVAALLTLDTGTDYVKRVIGLPGDQVICCDVSGRLLLNGVPVDEPYLQPGDRPSALTFDVTVPAAHMWVMGDHRSDSGDSRSYLGRPGGGMVPLDDVIGQATVRYWPPGRLGSLGGPGPLSTVPSSSGAGQ